MSVAKISSISTFTIFLTLLLLSSRIYCQGSDDDEDCDDDDGSSNPTTSGSGPGPGPGTGPGSGQGSGGDIFGDLLNPNSQFAGKLEQLLEPVSGLVDTLATDITSLSIAATNLIFDMLPAPVSKLLRTPVESVLNNLYDILFGLDDLLKALASGDGAGILKGLDEALKGVTGFTSTSQKLLDVLNDAGVPVGNSALGGLISNTGNQLNGMLGLGSTDATTSASSSDATTDYYYYTDSDDSSDYYYTDSDDSTSSSGSSTDGGNGHFWKWNGK